MDSMPQGAPQALRHPDINRNGRKLFSLKVRCQLLVCLIRYIFYHISYFFTHCLWKIDSVAVH